MKKLSLMLILTVLMLVLTLWGTGEIDKLAITIEIDKLAITILIGLGMIISYKLGKKRGAMLGAILGARRAIEKISSEEEMQK